MASPLPSDLRDALADWVENIRQFQKVAGREAYLSEAEQKLLDVARKHLKPKP